MVMSHHNHIAALVTGMLADRMLRVAGNNGGGAFDMTSLKQSPGARYGSAQTD
jgi:hypothetical protein